MKWKSKLLLEIPGGGIKMKPKKTKEMTAYPTNK